MSDPCGNKPMSENSGHTAMQGADPLSHPSPHWEVALQCYAHVCLPTFCITTQKHCWLGSPWPEERQAWSQPGLHETHSLRNGCAVWKVPFMRGKQKVNSPQLLKSELWFPCHSQHNPPPPPRSGELTLSCIFNYVPRGVLSKMKNMPGHQ